MCYLILFHISLAVVAIVCFVKGKLQISPRWVATGAPAIFAGVILLLPFPLTLVILVLVSLIIGRQGGWNPVELERWGDDHGFAFVLMILGITGVCLSLSFLIAMLGARDPAELEKERPRRDDWDDDYDDRDERRERRDYRRGRY